LPHACEQGRGCEAGSPGETYLLDTKGNDGVNKLEDMGVNVGGWFDASGMAGQ